MARSKGPPSRLRTAPAAASAGAVAARAETHAPKKKTSPAQFLREVRAEGRKITWPSRRETWITSVMVMIMVLVTTLFFWVVDAGLAFAIQGVLRLAGGA
ncbi:MAG TPA: preprotein translocase subunit SecE [Caulobacteraceae bacterium]|jgi:preprotein translocase subunit SecE